MAEAITDSQNKKTLFMQSAYKVKMSVYIQEKEIWKKRVAEKMAQKKAWDVDSPSSRPNVLNEATPNTSILPHNEKYVNSFEEKNFNTLEHNSEEHRIKPTQTHPNERAKIQSEMAKLKAELQGKSHNEIAKMTEQHRSKSNLNSNKTTKNIPKPPSNNSSNGNTGR